MTRRWHVNRPSTVKLSKSYLETPKRTISMQNFPENMIFTPRIVFENIEALEIWNLNKIHSYLNKNHSSDRRDNYYEIDPYGGTLCGSVIGELISIFCWLSNGRTRIFPKRPWTLTKVLSSMAVSVGDLLLTFVLPWIMEALSQLISGGSIILAT